MAAAMLVVSWLLTIASVPFVVAGGAASARARGTHPGSTAAAYVEQRKATGLFVVAGMAVMAGKILGDFAWLVGYPMAERCELSDLLVEQCTCRLHRPEQAIDPMPASVASGWAFEARFAARCPDCGDDIDVGDDICRTTDGEYIHAECAAARRLP